MELTDLPNMPLEFDKFAGLWLCFYAKGINEKASMSLSVLNHLFKYVILIHIPCYFSLGGLNTIVC
jgi:hypothetical protein